MNTNQPFMCRCCGEYCPTQRKLEEHYIENSQKHQKALEDGMGKQMPKMLKKTADFIHSLRMKHQEEDGYKKINFT